MDLEELYAEGAAWLAKVKSHLSTGAQTEIKTVENEGHAVVDTVVAGVLTGSGTR